MGREWRLARRLGGETSRGRTDEGTKRPTTQTRLAWRMRMARSVTSEIVDNGRFFRV